MKQVPFFFIIFVLTACTSDSAHQCEKASAKDSSQNREQLSAKTSQQFDLDLDGTPDEITWNFSGGAHCCYQLSITLSSTKIKTDFPFNMDGGYTGGVPMDDRVKDRDGDGYPELYMRIETYNGEANEIPAEWKKTYGISGNDILIEVEKGRLVVSDGT